MCTGSYQFRSYTATRAKQCRRFRIMDEDDIQKSFCVNISQFEEDNRVALCRIFHHLEEDKGLPIKDKSIFMPKYGITFVPKNQCYASFEVLSDKQLFFKSYKGEPPSFEEQVTETQSPQVSMNMTMSMDIQQQQEHSKDNKQHQNSSGKKQSQQNIIEQFQQIYIEQFQQKQIQPFLHEKKQIFQTLIKTQNNKKAHIQQQQHNDQEVKVSQKPKKIKQPQRNIGDVIMAVKKWRTLHDQKKVNLAKGAAFIGISKKSLDDYFLVLRIGEILNFDYANNLDKKMGILRTHIRSFDQKITGKLPKQVKCFSLLPQLCSNKLMKELKAHKSNDIQLKQQQHDEWIIQQNIEGSKNTLNSY